MNNILMDIIKKLYQKEEGIIAIRHYNNFCINADKLFLFKESDEKVKIVHRDFCDARVSRPFDPFLQTINELRVQHELRIDEVLDNCQIYPLHREIYESYFTNGIATRKEQPLINEINFEQQLFIEEIARMLEFFRPLGTVKVPENTVPNGFLLLKMNNKERIFLDKLVNFQRRLGMILL